MKCKKCESRSYVKSGFMNEKQRFKCKECGYHFTEGDNRGKPAWLKRFALFLYLEGIGFRSIERILHQVGEGVSHVAVINWIRDLGKEVRDLKKEETGTVSVLVMELDEMWHFVQKKRISCGYGLHLIEKKGGLLHSFWAVEAKQLAKSSGKK